MKTYNIKAAFQIDPSICPPVIVEQLFPGVTPEFVQMEGSRLTVGVADDVIPADLGPLVKVEQVS